MSDHLVARLWVFVDGISPPEVAMTISSLTATAAGLGLIADNLIQLVRRPQAQHVTWCFAALLTLYFGVTGRSELNWVMVLAILMTIYLQWRDRHK